MAQTMRDFAYRQGQADMRARALEAIAPHTGGKTVVISEETARAVRAIEALRNDQFLVRIREGKTRFAQDKTVRRAKAWLKAENAVCAQLERKGRK